MSHCRPRLLVWCLTIGHACWRSTSLSAMPVGEVHYYRPCLLVWNLTIGHSWWSVATATDILLVECRWNENGYDYAATLKEVPLHQTWLLILSHSEISMDVQCNSIRHACWVHLIRYTCFCLFCCFTSQVNSNVHGGTVSSPNHTFSWSSLNKQLTSSHVNCFQH